MKRDESEKVRSGDSWRHAKVTLKPTNPDFAPIVLEDVEEDAVQVIAELVDVCWERMLRSGRSEQLAVWSLNLSVVANEPADDAADQSADDPAHRSHCDRHQSADRRANGNASAGVLAPAAFLLGGGHR